MSSAKPTVVYVALGTRRIPAAVSHTAALAAAGEQVLLVVGEKTEVSAPEGVTLRRVTPAQARRIPLEGVRMLCAGDIEATPIADAARRRFPGLDVRLEPVGDPGRRPAPADLAVVTPWYPSPNDAFAGSFVEATVAALRGDRKIAILQNENWFYDAGGVRGQLHTVTSRRETKRPTGAVTVDTPLGELTRVVTPQPTHRSYASRTTAHVERLREVLPGGRIEAPLIHAHTGHYAGVVAAELARDDARIVVTEHVTFLKRVLSRPEARKQYNSMLHRVNRVLCVGRALRDLLAAEFPAHTGKLLIVPNPIDFDHFEPRPARPAAPSKLLYVGRMIEHKGVQTLLEAFGKIAAEHADTTLTLVGDGPLVESLRARSDELGLAGRVTQIGAVSPERVAGLMREHDLLVHASTVETFGMTVVEAVATGTPVLVAASDGPAETLDGLDGMAGALFPVTTDPGTLVSAYAKLRERWSQLDPETARERLRERYGSDAVASRLREIYAEVMAEEPAKWPGHEQEPMPAPEPGADRIALVALEHPGNQRARDYIRACRKQGYGVDLISSEPSRWPWYAEDDGVRIFGLEKSEERRFSRRLERLLVTRLPGRVLGALRFRAGRLASPLPEVVALVAEQQHRRLSGSFDRRIYERWYRAVRPRILWRVTRREVVPSLDRDRIRRVVVNGQVGVTIGWELAKSNPDLPVTTDLTPPTEPARVR